MTAEQVMSLINGARAVNRHDVAVALQALLIRARFEPSNDGTFAEDCIIDVICDAAIRSTAHPRTIGVHAVPVRKES